jgi:hypothetical protein
MAKKKISVEFSQRGIEQLKKELLDYKDTLQYKVDLLAKTLAETGVDVARANVARLDAIFTGELISSIHTKYGGSSKGTVTFYLVADSEHAIYVELGTGMVGASKPYPGKLPIIYAQGKTIRPATEDIYVRGELYVRKGEYFWTYIGEDGKAHITKGMPSKPFMYETSLDLMKLVVKIAKGVFK